MPSQEVQFFTTATSPEEHKRKSRAALKEYMAALGEASADADFDWQNAIGRRDVARDVLAHKVIVTSGENKYADQWGQTGLCVGAVAWMCRQFLDGPKDDWGFLLTRFKGVKRQTADALEKHGELIDDDGVIGRGALITGVAQSDFFVAMYATHSDGKYAGIIDSAEYGDWSANRNLPKRLTDKTAADFLNRNYPHGPAYRNVKVRLEGVEHQPKGYGIPVTFELQERTRCAIFYERALNKSLLDRFRKLPGAYLEYGRRVERQIFGRNGCDKSCLKINQFGYLPTRPINNPAFGSFAGTFGHKLFDPVPLAEEVLTEFESKSATTAPKVKIGLLSSDLKDLWRRLRRIPSDLPYPEWRNAIWAIHHATDGSDEGRELAHRWSARDRRYREQQVDMLWDSADPDYPQPVTLATLFRLEQKYNPQPTISAVLKAYLEEAEDGQEDK